MTWKNRAAEAFRKEQARHALSTNLMDPTSAVCFCGITFKATVQGWRAFYDHIDEASVDSSIAAFIPNRPQISQALGSHRLNHQTVEGWAECLCGAAIESLDEFIEHQTDVMVGLLGGQQE